MYLHHLANILANTNGISKVHFHYLVNTLTSTNDKADNFTKEEIWLHPTNSLLFIIMKIIIFDLNK